MSEPASDDARRRWREEGHRRDAQTKALYDLVFRNESHSKVWNALERALHGSNLRPGPEALTQPPSQHDDDTPGEP